MKPNKEIKRITGSRESEKDILKLIRMTRGSLKSRGSMLVDLQRERRRENRASERKLKRLSASKPVNRSQS
jgi:hypothetical protein